MKLSPFITGRADESAGQFNRRIERAVGDAERNCAKLAADHLRRHTATLPGPRGHLRTALTASTFVKCDVAKWKDVESMVVIASDRRLPIS